MKELQICKLPYIPWAIKKECNELFAQEVIRLWDGRCLQGEVYYFEDVDSPVAFILVEKRKDKASIIRGLYVKPDHRKNGLASQLVSKVCTECGKNGVIVNITRGAEGVYLKHGFEIVGKRTDYCDQSVAFWGDVSNEERETWTAKTLQKNSREI